MQPATHVLADDEVGVGHPQLPEVLTSRVHNDTDTCTRTRSPPHTLRV
jgi:hypothetical protein